MLEAHDSALKHTENEEVNPYQHANGVDRVDDGLPDRGEKLTRVRLVQFHKNPNEPMVCVVCCVLCVVCCVLCVVCCVVLCCVMLCCVCVVLCCVMLCCVVYVLCCVCVVLCCVCVVCCAVLCMCCAVLCCAVLCCVVVLCYVYVWMDGCFYVCFYKCVYDVRACVRACVRAWKVDIYVQYTCVRFHESDREVVGLHDVILSTQANPACH